MPKQKLNVYFLSNSKHLHHLQLGLFKDVNATSYAEIDKTKASKECIITLQNILTRQSITIVDLSFIGANQGPGPFTTLRVAIATVNGLSFATNCPLIGINGIQALLNEYADQPYSNKAAILNAFGNDIYYGLQTKNHYHAIGCGNITTVLLEAAQKMPDDKILFLGNGISVYAQQIKEIIGDRAVFLPSNPQTACLDQIAKMALEQWNAKQNLSYQLQPLYFKSAFIR